MLFSASEVQSRNSGRERSLTLKQVYLDYVLFIQGYAPIQIYFAHSNHLTPGRLMRKAAKKTRQAGEKRIAARDIRKVTMVCSAHPGNRPWLIMVCRLRCGSSEDDRSTRARKHYLNDGKPTSIPSSMPRNLCGHVPVVKNPHRSTIACCITEQHSLLDAKYDGAPEY
jgi:hypothetical protein